MIDNSLERALREVTGARLQPTDWAEVADELRTIAADGTGPERLTTTLFEAKVRGRFQGGRTGADVAPTKQTSVLPVVGVVCGAFLFGIGTLLGGGIILVGIALLGVFVFGVAFAGSRVAHRGSADQPAEPVAEPTPMPAEVAALVEQIRSGGA